LNRNLGRFAQHSNGLLSRYAPDLLEDHKLPGFMPGRGAILTSFGKGQDSLLVVMMHLALSTKARANQLAYIRERISDHKHVVLMGDMNTHAEDLLERSPLKGSDLHTATLPGTYPSWKPARVLDHMNASMYCPMRFPITYRFQCIFAYRQISANRINIAYRPVTTAR